MNGMRPAERATAMTETKISARNVDVFYGETHAIKDVRVDIADKTVTAFIGPSGSGKSIFLRCLNRMNDTIGIARVEGQITLDGEDIYDPTVDPVQLRQDRHGVPEVEPVDQVDLRQRGLRHSRNGAQQGRDRRRALRRAALWKRPRTACMRQAPASRAGSSSASASRGRSRPNPRFC